MVVRSRGWVFTVFNSALRAMVADTSAVKLLAYQLEVCPDTLRMHHQGMVEFNSVKTAEQAKAWVAEAFNVSGPHVEKRNGSPRQAYDYATKDATRCDGESSGPWVHGDPPAGAGARTDLKDVQTMLDEGKSIKEVAEAHFGTYLRYNRGLEKYANMVVRQRRDWNTDGVVFWGPPGSGKTARVHAVASGSGALFVASYPTQHSGPEYFDGYLGESSILYDDFYGQIRQSTLLRILDRYPLSLPVRGGQVEFVARTVYFTSNVDPDRWYPRRGLGGLTRRLNFVYYIGDERYPTAESWMASSTYKELTGQLRHADNLPAAPLGV